MYHVAAPLIWALGPLRGLAMALALMSYVGLPLAVWYALRKLGRPPWGAILAFVLVYTKSWSQGGYVPFVSAAALVIWSITEFSLAFRSDFSPRVKQRAWLKCTALCVLVFLAHAQVYVWMTSFFALMTVARLSAAIVHDPVATLRERFVNSAKVGVRALAMITPSLLLAAQWSARSGVSGSLPLKVHDLFQQDNLQGKWLQVLHSMTLLLGEFEIVFVIAFVGVLVVAWLAAPRPASSIGIFEAATLWALVCYLVLPDAVNRQSIAARHLDILYWLLPTAIFAQHWPAASAAKMHSFATRVALALVVGFAVVRTFALSRAMQSQHSDTTVHLLRLESQCVRAQRLRSNGAPVRLAGMVIQLSSAVFHSISLQQVHMVVAALCRVETSTFDSNFPPSNLLPLHRRAYSPFVLSVLAPDTAWFLSTQIPRDVEWVLTVGWTPTERIPALEARTELIAREGHFSLYRWLPRVGTN